MPEKSTRAAPAELNTGLRVDVTDPAGPASEAERRRGSCLLRSRWDLVLVIGAGGAVGSLARWGMGELLPWTGEGFPWATFIVNLSGSFALGVLVVVLLDMWPPGRYARPFLGVGLLGGYTTFSTYMLEARDLLAAEQVATAACYLAGSLLAGLVAVWLGIAAARLSIGLAQQRGHRGDAVSRPVPARTDDDPGSTA